MDCWGHYCYLCAVVMIIASLIVQKWPRGHGIERDIELYQQSASNSFLPSTPPPQYEESEGYNRPVARGAFKVKESLQQRDPISRPPEQFEDIIIVDDDRRVNGPQDVHLDAIEQELQPQHDEEPEEEAAAAVPDVGNDDDGSENQDISLHEESVNLENPNDLNHEGAVVPPGGRSPMQLLLDENNPLFESMRDIHFDEAINRPDFVVNIEGEMPLNRLSSDSGADDTSMNDSMDQIVPNLESHVENHETGSAPPAGGRLENTFEGRLSLAVEPFGYACNDEGSSTDETGEGSSLN